MDVETSRSAVIVGGGIGGLTAAIALHRAGWAVTVFEQTPHGKPVGAGLAVWPNAVRALNTLGLATQLHDRAAVMRSTGIRLPSGRWLSRIDGDRLVSRYGEPLLAIARPDLVELLAAALPPGSLQLGATVTEVDPGGADRQASVLCGDRLVTADLVVAADGVGSRVRRALWPASPAPRYCGYTVWRALVPMPGIIADGAGETWGKGERFGIFPVSNDLAYVYATANAPAGGSSTDVAELRRRFGHWHDPIPAVLAAIEPGGVLRHDVVALAPSLRHFHHGRVALLGDAAHAMEPNLGQGACLAIEDAVVLAHTLTGRSPVTAALTGYSHARVQRAARLARQSRLLGRLTQSPAATVVAVRDTVTRFTPNRRILRGFDAAVGWFPPTRPDR